MEVITLQDKERYDTLRHSSKGNQLKWRHDDFWYKADYMGYEGLAEVVISRLLHKSDIREFTEYEPVRIQYQNRILNGCRSRNFLQKGEELITADRLFRQFTGKNLSRELGRMADVQDRILYLVENVEEITRLKEFGAYLTAALELDALFLNEDRHVNNIAVIYQEDGQYRLCPYFDHGLALYADTSVDFSLDRSLEICRQMIEAKPFSRDFDEQLDAAEQLYGKQIKFWFSERDIREELQRLSGIYDDVILQRVETLLNRQIQKYQYLFVK